MYCDRNELINYRLNKQSAAPKQMKQDCPCDCKIVRRLRNEDAQKRATDPT